MNRLTGGCSNRRVNIFAPYIRINLCLLFTQTIYDGGLVTRLDCFLIFQYGFFCCYKLLHVPLSLLLSCIYFVLAVNYLRDKDPDFASSNHYEFKSFLECRPWA